MKLVTSRPAPSFLIGNSLLLTAALLVSLPSAARAQDTLDSDADGMIDAWEIQHFGSLNHPAGGPAADPDADGCDNLAEAGAGTDPNDRSDCLKIASVQLTSSALQIAWPTIHGKRYQIDLSRDLLNWNTISNVAGNRPLNFFGTGGMVNVDFPSTSIDNLGGPAVVTGGVTREIWYHGQPNGTILHLRRYINPSTPIDPTLPFEEVPGNPEGVQELEQNTPVWKIRPEVKPDGVEWRSSLKGPSNYGDNYGDRWRGFIVPKQTASYNFYIAGRHQCEFWLDTTGNPTDGIGLARRCHLYDDNLTEEEDWDYLASQGLTDTQKSPGITLSAGRAYYFEILHNHNGQWDHLAVGWEADQSGTIDVLPGDCLRPLEDFLTSNDYTITNSPGLLTGTTKNFVRITTFGPLSEGTLDADGDGVADDVENVLDGYQFFRRQSAVAGQNDDLTLAAAGTAVPDQDVMTVEVQDALGREETGTTSAGIPRVKDVARFYLNRAGSLVPKTVFFRINGATDPISKGDPGPGDYVAERPNGTPLVPSGILYAATVPFGGTRAVVEINPVLDEIVEYPEEVNLVLIHPPGIGTEPIDPTQPANTGSQGTGQIQDLNRAPRAPIGPVVPPPPTYIIGTPSQGAADLHDARDEAEFNKYYIATFSKDDAAVTSTSASGSTLLVLNGSNRIATINDFFENLTSAQTNTHVHKATLDPDGITLRSGPIVESITDDGTETGNAILGPVSNYTYLIEPRGGFSVQDIIDALEFDNPEQGNPSGTTPLYNNKHTANNASGEIWAIYQRRPASELSPEAAGRIPPTPPIEPIDPVTEPDKLRRDVARFLTQATFGPTEADIEELLYQIVNVHGGDRIAAYNAWIDAQWALPQTLVRDLTHALDMQELTHRGYFDPARNQAAAGLPEGVPVAPSDWPSWPSQDLSSFDSLQIPTWQSPDADYPLTSGQIGALQSPLGIHSQNNRRRAQWTIMANARDQLRQRVGFSLSEILVVSAENAQVSIYHIGAGRWLDMLAENADDHYREAIEDVTYSPLMGKYLSHLQNTSETVSGVPADENYAREIKQLFTIGLFEIWDDGFIKLDPSEWNIIPTYDNADIKELARVMTGMSFSTVSNSRTLWDEPVLDRTNPGFNYNYYGGYQYYGSSYNYPMAFYDANHDNGDKTIAGGILISNDGTPDGRYTSEGDKDLRDVHNYLAGTQLNTTPKTFASSWSTDPMVNHQNTPGFVCRRLIQRHVTSNPSGPYLYRVAQVWRNTNGKIDEVVRAILLDPEARNPSTTETNPEFGKKKEPIVAWIQSLRAAASRSRVTFDGTVIPGDPVDFPTQVHAGFLAPTSDGDLRNFDYPQNSIDKFQGVVAYDATGQMTSAGPGTFVRLPGTQYRLGRHDTGGTRALGQAPLRAPSVFNWFLPDYQPGGLIASYGLVAPEFQLATEGSVLQNVNMSWRSHWNPLGFYAEKMGGNDANSAAAGYATTWSTGTYHSDQDIIPDYWAWIHRYENYPVDPTNGLNDEQDKDLQLLDDLDALLLAGRYQLLYPVNPADDGTPTTQGALIHYPNRNPRETLLYYLGDTWSHTNQSNIWNKVRSALYALTTTPEFYIQK